MAAMDELLRRATADLTSLHARHALVGGHAVSMRTEPRFTRDLDLAIAVDGDAQAEALIRSMGLRGYRVVAIIEQETTGRLATVRLEHPSAPGVMLDLLFATAGIEPEVVASATLHAVLPGLSVPVASVGHLLALKTLSMDDDRRPQDRMDLMALLRIAKSTDLQAAERAMDLITTRGTNRGRELRTLFAACRGTPEA
jgi:hypothetical protein